MPQSPTCDVEGSEDEGTFNPHRLRFARLLGNSPEFSAIRRRKRSCRATMNEQLIKDLKIISWIPDLRAGGAETSLLLELKQLRMRGFDVAVGMIAQDATLVPLYEEAGIQVHTLGNGSRLSRFRRIWFILRTERPDLVEVILFWPNVVVRPVAWMLGIKVVTQLANEEYGTVQRNQSKYGASGVSLAQAMDLLTSRFANHFRAVSRGVGSSMHNRLLIRKSKISVIHIARDLAELGRRSNDRRLKSRRALGIDESAFVILCTGRQDAQKNQTTAIQAMEVLIKSVPNSVLLVAGRPGKWSPLIAELLHQSPNALDVRLLGERDDVPELLCAADAFLMPSLWEGFSGAVVEAMALEIPLVLSDIQSMHEVTNGEAWYFPPTDFAACAELLRRVANHEYPMEMVEQGRLRAELELDIHAIATDLEDMYRDLLETKE